MADAFDSGEGLAVEGESVDLNQLKGLFTEWLDSDVQDGIYRYVQYGLQRVMGPRQHTESHALTHLKKRAPVGRFLNFWRCLCWLSQTSSLSLSLSLSLSRLPPPEQLCVPRLVWQPLFFPRA